ncbi:MAG: hypothetical protein R2939_21720 [Kofleriaceae bacterium]
MDATVDAGGPPASTFVGCAAAEQVACASLAPTYAAGTATCRADLTGFDVTTCAVADRPYDNELVKPAERDPARWATALTNNGEPWSLEVSLSPTGSDVWIIRLGGGGFCDDDLLSCRDRASLAQGVGAADGSDLVPAKYAGMRQRWVEGPSGTTPNDGANPALWDANFAQFNYRSSTLWTGASLAASDTSCRNEGCVLPGSGPSDCAAPTLPNGEPCTGQWYRRGRINIAAGVEILMQRFGLDDTTARVLYVGTSAGAYGVQHTADLLVERLPMTAARGDLRLVPDGAWAADFDLGSHRLGDQYSTNTAADVAAFATSFARLGATLLPTCVAGESAAGRDPTRCADSVVAYDWLTRPATEGGLSLPVLVLKSRLDTIEMGFHLDGTTGVSILEDDDARTAWIAGQDASLADVPWLVAGACQYHTTVELQSWWPVVGPVVADFVTDATAPRRLLDQCPPPQCASSAQCNDGDPATTDVCAAGVCINRECTRDDQCDDGDPLTEDVCRAQRCEARACYQDTDCDDGNPVTLERCRDYACETAP